MEHKLSLQLAGSIRCPVCYLSRVLLLSLLVFVELCQKAGAYFRFSTEDWVGDFGGWKNAYIPCYKGIYIQAEKIRKTEVHGALPLNQRLRVTFTQLILLYIYQGHRADTVVE